MHEQKRDMVSARLEKLVRQNGFCSFGEYIGYVSLRKHSLEFTELIDTLTTNHSGFWREPEHFVFLQNMVLPSNPNRLRIWSAACATGEEPYTIAMCALEAGLQGCSITASDISRSALSIARRGVYAQAKIAALPTPWCGRYFSRTGETARDYNQRSVAGGARALVHYSAMNLLHPFEHLGQFDVIFCRNAMIYFGQVTRDQLVARLARQLREGGYLFTGHSETLLRPPAELRYIQPAVYRKVG